MIQRWASAICACALLACDTTPEAVHDDAGLAALLDWRAIPSLYAARSRQFSSRDREEASMFAFLDAGNKDFDSFLAVCGDRPALFDQQVDDVRCDPGLQGYLIASDDAGPGYVSRIQMTTGRLGSDPRDSNWTDERIRIYSDDVRTPVYEGRLADWQARTSAPFVEPLTTWNADAISSYVPISYDSKLRIVLDALHTDNLYYYQVDVHSSANTARFDPQQLAHELPRSWDALADADSDGTLWVDQAFSVDAGATALLLDRDQPGTIAALRLSVDPAALGSLQLQAAWDGEEQPSVDIPVIWLFGESDSVRDYATLVMSASTDDDRVVLTLALPMPFTAAARLSIRNDGAAATTLNARITGSERVPEGAFGHLHALWHESLANDPDASHLIAELAGRGKYVGTLLALQGHADESSAVNAPLSFLEGDETAVIDGVTAIQGTGTEDFLNGSWYFDSEHHDTPFATLIDVSTDPAAQSGSLRAVRWNILHDAIPFEHSFKFSLEVGANKPATRSRYDSVAFYYLE